MLQPIIEPAGEGVVGTPEYTAGSSEVGEALGLQLVSEVGAVWQD